MNKIIKAVLAFSLKNKYFILFLTALSFWLLGSRDRRRRREAKV